MKIAICDDDEQELQQIRMLLDEFFAFYFKEEKNEIHAFASAFQLVDRVEAGNIYDVYLLDIIMPGINGMNLASEIRIKDHSAKIIFLTASSEYAVDSYSVNAFYYFLKPVKKEKLFDVIEQACNDIIRDSRQYILVRTDAGLSKIFLNTLVYVEVSKRTVFFYTKNGGAFVSFNTIRQIEEMLFYDKRFIKPHRSYIVNLEYIKNFSRSGIATINNITIPISRNSYKTVKQAYVNHAFSSGNQWGNGV